MEKFLLGTSLYNCTIVMQRAVLEYERVSFILTHSVAEVSTRNDGSELE